ncbi:YtxH-like protein [compost metagenome]
MKAGENKTKKEEKSGNVSKVVGALVAGAAIGVATGILLAPDKGKKTREKLLDDAKDLADKVKDRANNGINSIKKG